MMTRSFKGSLLATTLLAGVAASGPAFAQDATAPAPSQDPNVQAAPTDQTPAQQENLADTPAQDPQDVESGARETIVVTGTRIVSPNITSLAPVQVVGEAEIDQSGAINIQDVLLENPAFGTPGSSRTNSAFGSSGGGSATIDLRDLGSDRTLILVNGRRVVGGFGGSPTVDLTNIPTQFVDRIDILTGGASSLYGSDAVAGVVNFIYKRNFEGILAEGQYGITQRGDTPNYQVSLTMGSNFGDDRGNIMVHLGYTNEGQLLSRQRKDTRIDNRSLFWYVTGLPEDYNTPQVPFFSSFPPQGRFGTGSGANAIVWTYSPTGELQPCFTSNGATCTSALGTGVGPNGFNRSHFRSLAVPVKRYVFATNATYDITDNISAILEGTYVKTTSSREIEPFAYDSGGANPGFPTGVAPIEHVVTNTLGVDIIVRNAFVPDEIFNAATDTDGDGLRDIVLARRLVELGSRFSDVNRDMFRFVTGLQGKIFDDRFSWDITYNIGRTTEDQFSNGQYNLPLLQAALQSVRETAATGDLNGNGVLGDIVCSDPLRRNDTTPCVPINFFGVGSITPQAAQYVAAELGHQISVQQQVWAANLSGSAFELPAGPLGIAIGAEYRKEKSRENWDALTNAGLTGGNALPDTSGQFSVKELYGEVNVPVLRDVAFANQLNLRAAGRLSDYSTVGSVKTWSIGADYAPISDIRLRGTLAQAVRAPNIGELFTGPSQTFPTGLLDPCADIDPNTAGLQGVTLTSAGVVSDNCRAAPGVIENINLNGGVFVQSQPDQQGISGLISGNPNLKEETARSFTLGVVINPRSIDALRNLVLSVDYYSIKIDDAVNVPDADTTLNQCYREGNPVFCSFIIRRATASGSNSPGSLAFVNGGAVNSGGIKTRGIDTVLQYRTSLDSLMSGLGMSARVSWTHLLEGWVIDLPGAPKDDFAGEIGTARDRVNATVGFDFGKWALNLTGNYIGKSYENDVDLEGIGLEDDDVSVPAQFYLDTQVTFTPAREYELFLGVDNVFDNKAPDIFQGSDYNITGANTAADVYDIFGRRFYAGARLRF